MSASSLVFAAQAALEKARTATNAAEEAAAAARRAEVLAREALEASQLSLQLKRMAEDERRPASVLSSLSSLSSGPDRQVEDDQRRSMGANYNHSDNNISAHYNHRNSSALYTSRDSGALKNHSESRFCGLVSSNEIHESVRSNQSRSFGMRQDNLMRSSNTQRGSQYESVCDGLDVLWRKSDDINAANLEEKQSDQSRSVMADFDEEDEYDDNLNLKSMKNPAPPSSDTSSPRAYSNTKFKEARAEGANRADTKSMTLSPICQNCKLQGMCLHGRFLERVVPRTTGMKAGAIFSKENNKLEKR